MLAMWLISRKQAGKDPPAALTPDMVPPTMRPKGQDAVSTLDLQLNLHETDLLFRNLSHHLTWHCLLIYGFFPRFYQFLRVEIIKLSKRQKNPPI